ncbi:hypothetical protein H696_01631 [Fonticula alba]|uniref:Cytochrome b5 heme-binding domain-containing protein n=1 Tax=Fonticula alba TaxID=691883 RepID=A0A058ZE54_FONAL|nr:hypothetical protein H696_01631 [Fonticula alba]KCV72231.1 hypothetical protein H696_01631 [Fonticula alba]|eukprot:XP_009493809.1 hypothetical protein H696_01631 [Fonticula alba]
MAASKSFAAEQGASSVAPPPSKATPAGGSKAAASAKPATFVIDPLRAGLFAATAAGTLAAPYLGLAPDAHCKTLALAGGMYLLGHIGHYLGYHRMAAHRNVRVSTPLVKLLLLGFGAANAFEGPAIDWALRHRVHHAHANTEADPLNAKAGFVRSALLGPLGRTTPAPANVSVSDLEVDGMVALQLAMFPILSLAFGVLLPGLVAATWGDLIGGIFYAGIVRMVLFSLVNWFASALARTFGEAQLFGPNAGFDNLVANVLTFGENFLNFHHAHPDDHRAGALPGQLDLVSIIVWVLAALGLAVDIKQKPDAEILTQKLDALQAIYDQTRSEISWGVDPETLPLWTKATFDAEVRKGRQLMVIDAMVHDVADFFDKHPGGAEVLVDKVGKDTTIAFNGGVQRHSKAARNLLTQMRIARLAASDAEGLEQVVED